MEALQQIALVCFSHLRWNFVYQRPQHLMSRFSKTMRVIFIEEPVPDGNYLHFSVTQPLANLWVVTPHIQPGVSEADAHAAQKSFISNLLETVGCHRYGLWYYTPMALAFSDHLEPEFIVYDCMDELTAFKFAPPMLKEFEKRLLDVSTVVFTGGHSLYAAKKHMHANMHPFPSSIEYEHFKKARELQDDPSDQKNIPHPRIGFYGVIDERMDLAFVKQAAALRPEWHFVFLGPIAKIDQHELPQSDNVHFLGMKQYEELPAYLAGWDIAFMPFALNEATRYISPTKTPEYLAAGKPVVSTAINDVVAQYGNVVHIVSTPEEFVRVVEEGLGNDSAWLQQVDRLLAQNSWDITWARMCDIIEKAMSTRRRMTDFNIVPLT